MEISNEFLEHLNKNAKPISINELLVLGDVITMAFPKLVEMGKRGEIFYTEWNGKRYYSYMSEDEMYRVLSGKTKFEYETYEEQRKQAWEEQKARDREACETFKKEKLPEIKTLIKTEYSEAESERVISVWERELNSGNAGCINKIKDHVKILGRARMGSPQAALKEYIAVDTVPGNRLYNHGWLLVKSRHAEVFKDTVIADIKNEYGMHGEEEVQKIIKKRVLDVQPAEQEQQPGE